ncbi:hypothetical protein X975_07912, partial [Stegodyphus mimosarum]
MYTWSARTIRILLLQRRRLQLSNSNENRMDCLFLSLSSLSGSEFDIELNYRIET